VQTLSKILQQKLENAKRVAILGVGSELRGDDAAGILTARQIEKISKKIKTPDVQVFIGDTAPENLTGVIKRFEPTHLIIIDSADLDKQPGEIEIIAAEAICGTSFCTHTLPNSVLADYLRKSFNFELITIGIQPKTLAFGASPSKEVLKATKQLSAAIAKILATT